MALLNCTYRIMCTKLEASTVECRSILSIGTLSQHLNQYSVNTLSTFDQQTVINVCKVSQMLPDSCELITN